MTSFAEHPALRKYLHNALIAITVAALVGVTAWFSIVLTRGTGHVAAIWISNGLLAGILLTAPRRHWPRLLVGGFIGNASANWIGGDQLSLALLLPLCNSIEITAGCVITRALGTVDYLGWRFHLSFLAGCVIAGPLIAAIPVSFVLAWHFGPASLQNLWTWLPAHILGMAAFAPLVLDVRTSDFLPMLKNGRAIRTAVVLTIVAVTSVAVFYQSSYPLTYITIGVLVLAAFQLGRAGLAISICIVAVIAVLGTVEHRGPFNIVDVAMSEKIAAMQFYILSAILMTFPVAISVELTAKLKAEVVTANLELRELSLTDKLTKLSNRRAFDDALEREWRIALRNRSALSLLIIDVDRFKAYNDTYGHSAGDAILAGVGRLLRDIVFRPSDVVARIGGEEFAVILPGTNELGVREVAERIRDVIHQADMPAASSSFERITVSIGVGTTTPSGHDTMKTLFDIADSYLYQAKQNGRNRVEAKEPKENYDAALFKVGLASQKTHRARNNTASS